MSAIPIVQEIIENHTWEYTVSKSCQTYFKALKVKRIQHECLLGQTRGVY